MEYPQIDTCSECGRSVKLVLVSWGDPLYVHSDPVNSELPEQCGEDVDHRIATTALRDQTVAGSLSTELLAALTLSIIPTTIVLIFVARLAGMVAGVS